MFDQKQILDNLFDGLYTVTRDRQITYWNDAAQELTGYSANEMVGLHCYDGPLKHVDREGRDLCSDGCPLSWAIAHRCKHEDEIFLRHRDGHRVPINVRIAPLYDADGQVAGASELFRKNAPSGMLAERLAELVELAMLDPLTKLANEKYLEEQINQYLQEIVRYPIKIGVALFRIDHYQTLRKTHGQKAADQLQQIAGQTLKCNCRPLDLIARIDEGIFFGIFRNMTSNLLHATCEKMRLLFAKSHFAPNGEALQVTLSSGGLCLKKGDSYVQALERCRAQVDDCVKRGGNRTSVDIHFVTV